MDQDAHNQQLGCINYSGHDLTTVPIGTFELLNSIDTDLKYANERKSGLGTRRMRHWASGIHVLVRRAPKSL